MDNQKSTIEIRDSLNELASICLLCLRIMQKTDETIPSNEYAQQVVA